MAAVPARPRWASRRAACTRPCSPSPPRSSRASARGVPPARPRGQRLPARSGQSRPSPRHGEARARLAALEKELRRRQRGGALQFRARRGRRRRSSSWRPKLKAPRAWRQDRRGTSSGAPAGADPASRSSYPRTSSSRCEKLPGAGAEADETLAKIEAERQADVATGRRRRIPCSTTRGSGRAWRSARRRSSPGRAVTGPLKYVALLDIPAFGFSRCWCAEATWRTSSGRKLAGRAGPARGPREEGARAVREEAQPVRTR